MSTKSSYAINTIIIGSSKFLEQIFAYLIIVLLTRNLGAEGLGQYSFIFSFMGIMFIFSDIGLNQLFIKDISKDFSKINSYLSNIISIKIITKIIFLGVYFIVIFMVDKSEILNSLILIGLTQLFYFFSELFIAILRVKNKGLIIGFINVLERVLIFIGAIIVFYSTRELFHFIIVILFVRLIKTISLYILSHKYYSIGLSFDKELILNLIRNSYPFIFIGLFAIIYVQMDTVMLGFIFNDTVVGLYNAPYKLINLINIIPVTFLMFGYPLFSKLYAQNKDNLRELFENIYYYSFSLILPMVIGVFFIGDYLLNFVYGIKSPDSFFVFKILIIAEIFVFLTIIFNQLIAACDKQKVAMIIGGLGAFVNIILNFILIPKFSLFGAGISTLISYLLMFIIQFYYVRKHIISFRFITKLLPPMILATIMYLVLLQFVTMSPPIIFVVGCITYIGPFLILETIRNWELVWNLVYKLIPNIRK